MKFDAAAIVNSGAENGLRIFQRHRSRDLSRRNPMKAEIDSARWNQTFPAESDEGG